MKFRPIPARAASILIAAAFAAPLCATAQDQEPPEALPGEVPEEIPASPAPPPPPPEEEQGSSETSFEAIAQIEVSTIVPDFRTPWNAGRPGGGSGTGFLIGENVFLTNAHVVSNASKVIIRKVGDPAPHPAKILHIAHDCDLAMLALEDPEPFQGVEPLQIGGVPKLDTTVKVVGYPIGGERISVTRGVVSRIDFRPYSHSGVDLHLTIQIDAAINPGNSGGPVIQNDRVVGVAFQGYSGSVAQNTGYMIPVPVIQRFLKDVEDGSYDHYVDLSVSEFQIQNPAQRAALGITGNTGVMIAGVQATGSADGVVQEGDVLLAIDGNPVFNNGLVKFEGELVNMNEIVERRFAGDVLKLTLLRDGKEMEVEAALKRFLPYLIQANEYEKRPEYVMYAGLVFQPLDRQLMVAHGLRDQTIRYYFGNYVNDELFKEHPEVIILTTILKDSINTFLEGYAPAVVEEINGTTIKTLADVQTALANPPADSDFVTVKLHGEGRPIVLEKARVPEAHQRIMRQYQIDEDHYIEGESEDAAAKSEANNNR
ncbi:MAG: trypsin-like peptidase domain-containing protein [Verrucomicrobiales bacterium]